MKKEWFMKGTLVIVDGKHKGVVLGYTPEAYHRVRYTEDGVAKDGSFPWYKLTRTH